MGDTTNELMDAEGPAHDTDFITEKFWRDNAGRSAEEARERETWKAAAALSLFTQELRKSVDWLRTFRATCPRPAQPADTITSVPFNQKYTTRESAQALEERLHDQEAQHVEEPEVGP